MAHAFGKAVPGLRLPTARHEWALCTCSGIVWLPQWQQTSPYFCHHNCSPCPVLPTGRKTQLSSEKALRDLSGLGPLIPIEQSVRDMTSVMIDKGLLPDRRPAPKPEGAQSED